MKRFRDKLIYSGDVFGRSILHIVFCRFYHTYGRVDKNAFTFAFLDVVAFRWLLFLIPRELRHYLDLVQDFNS